MLARLLSLIAVGVLASPQDKVSFDWKPAKGTTGSYKTVNKHKGDFGGGEEDLLIEWTSKITVEKTENGKVWLKIENGQPTASVGGSEAPFINVQIPDSTEEHTLDGKFVPGKDYEGMGMGLYSGFSLPKSPLAKGDKYGADGLTATYDGTEKIGEWEAHKFTFTYQPKTKSEPWSEGTIWLSTSDLSLVKRKSVLHSIDFGMGPQDVSNEIVRTK